MLSMLLRSSEVWAYEQGWAGAEGPCVVAGLAVGRKGMLLQRRGGGNRCNAPRVGPATAN